MKKFLVTADLHLKLQEPYGRIDPQTEINTRLMDKMASLTSLVKTAKREKCDAFFILGDVYHRLNPPETLRRAFIRGVIRPLGKAGIPLYVLMGNHDTNLAGSYNLGGESDLGVLTLIEKPGSLEISGVKIDFLPFGFDAIPKGSGAKILMGHCMVDGAKMGGQDYAPGDGIPLRKFDRYPLVLMGHIHKAQTLKSASSKSPVTDAESHIVVYVGALARHTFGERDERRRAFILGVDGSDFDLAEISLEDRKFVQIELKEGEPGAIPAFPEGSILKLALTGTPSWIKSRDLGKAKEKLIEKGAHQVIFEFTLVRDKADDMLVPGKGKAIVSLIKERAKKKKISNILETGMELWEEAAEA